MRSTTFAKEFARRRDNRRGAMMVMVAIVLVILLVGAVFSVDVAYMHMVRAELRTATDAAARAGSEALARTQDPNSAVAAAIDIAGRNEVAGVGLTISAADIQVGSVEENASGRFDFVAGRSPFTAVRVSSSREDGSADGPVPLFFARVFNAGNFQPTEQATAAANVRDVALVLDVSGSMNANAGGISRLQALKAAVNVFLNEITISSPNTRVSLQVYATGTAKLVNLTDNFNLVRNTVNALNAGGATAIGNGLLVGSDSLENDPLNRAFAAKTILVMTDGNHNRGPSPAQTVNTAIARDQQVHTITFGSGANQALMQQVALATDGGIHIHADDAGDLSTAFRDIARALSVVLVQ